MLTRPGYRSAHVISGFRLGLCWVGGVEAALRGLDATLIRIGDWPVVLDYYTPCLITSEATIAARPETVRAFMHAVNKGYREAAADPAEAAELLIAADPTAPAALIRASQPIVSAWYQAEAPRWGEQTLAR